MSKRQKKKAPAVEEVPAPDTEARIEYIYEDTQCVTGVEPEYKWGDIYDDLPQGSTRYGA